MKSLSRLSILTALSLILVAQIASAAPRGISLTTTPPNPSNENPVREVPLPSVPDDCSLISFEGVPDFGPVGTFVGPVVVTFGSSWLGLVDFDNGGNGNFANEPSPNTIAFFLDQADISIQLSPPVRFVQFQYVAAAQSLPITVYAYDALNNLINQASGNTVGTSFDGAACTGDPNGDFCLWDQISLVSGTNNISKVIISGAVSNQFGIDNLYFCTSTTATKASSWGMLKSLYR